MLLSVIALLHSGGCLPFWMCLGWKHQMAAFKRPVLEEPVSEWAALAEAGKCAGHRHVPKGAFLPHCGASKGPLQSVTPTPLIQGWSCFLILTGLFARQGVSLKQAFISL